jgi:hypothetical protein
MKRFLCFALVAVLTLALAGPVLAEGGKMALKVGDKVYACNCGADCPCQTMAKKAGKCACAKDMVEATVTKVEGDTAFLTAKGWDKPRPFAMTGKFACACDPKCDCNTISQQHGKCVCGEDMKPVS